MPPLPLDILQTETTLTQNFSMQALEEGPKTSSRRRRTLAPIDDYSSHEGEILSSLTSSSEEEDELIPEQPDETPSDDIHVTSQMPPTTLLKADLVT
jgi:hypothetical protein